jgi:ABC-type multidrug transport system permease subunit
VTAANISAVLPIAHVGHWLVDMAYFLPVVVFLAWLLVTQIRDRRRGRGGGEHAHRT